MPIEFRCSKCQKLLRTPDDAAGREAECPQCGTKFTVPASSSVASTMSTVVPAGSNPFQAPGAFDDAPLTMVGSGVLVPTPITIGGVYRTTWAIFLTRPWFVIGVALLAMIIQYGVTGILDYGVRPLLGEPGSGPATLGGLIISITTTLINIFFQLGLTATMLKVARGDISASFSDLFSGGKWLLNAIGAGILFGIMIVFGLLLLIIPGIWVSLTFWPYGIMIVDKNLGVMDSLKTAYALTPGNKLNVLALFLVTVLVCFVTCGLGFVVLAFLGQLGMVVTYLIMSGQPTAVQKSA